MRPAGAHRRSVRRATSTQIDHILLSRFGIFVIETKDFSGWIFGNEADAKWTSVHYRVKYRFQNPIRQNFRHVLAVQNLLEFIPRTEIRSLVVFCGSAQFKTALPAGVVHATQLPAYLRQFSVETISMNRMHYAVGRIEAARLALTGKTDVEHVETLRRRLRLDAV